MNDSQFKALIQPVIDAKTVQAKLNALKGLSIKIEKLNLDKSAINSLKKQLNAQNIEVKLSLENNAQLQRQAQQIGKSIGETISKQTQKESRSIGLAFGEDLKKTLDTWKDLGLKEGAKQALFDQLTKMPKVIFEIDNSMTSLYRVTDETDKKYSQFLKNATVKAQELGRSVSGLIDQTTEWAKAGYNLDQSSRLAETSTVYANVANVDDATAINDIMAAMKAFNIEATDSISIVDSLNKLGNEFTSDTASLGSGLSKSAAALSSAGNDFKQTLAMLAGGTKITGDASEMGDALTVLSLRLRGMKQELAALGEESDSVQSIYRIQSQILNKTKGKVNILGEEDSLRAPYEILKEISKVWDHISQTEQTNLLKIMGGEQHANSIQGLIQGFQSGQVEQAHIITFNADGSALQEQERWLDSLDSKVQQLNASFQGLSATIMNSDFLKGLVDSGTSVLNILDSMVKQFGVLGPLMAGGGIAAFVKNFDRPCNKGCLKIA